MRENEVHYAIKMTLHRHFPGLAGTSKGRELLEKVTIDAMQEIREKGISYGNADQS